MLRLRFGKKKPKNLKEEDVESIVQRVLTPYVKREDLQKRLKEIQDDEKKRQLWESLSPRKKKQLLKYIIAKKRSGNE